MKVSLFRKQNEKETLRNLSLNAFIEEIRKESPVVSGIRKELQYLPAGALQTHLDKLPLACFAAAYQRKNKQIVLSNYQGLILLEVNWLAGTEEVEEVKKAAASLPHTLAAFTGLGGRSVKIIIPFIRPDGTLPAGEQEALLFHLHAYRLAVKHYRLQLPFEISIREPHLRSGCHFTSDPACYYNPEAQAIRLQQPLQKPEEETFREAIKAEANPLNRMLPGYSRYRTLSAYFETSLTDTVQTLGSYPDEASLKEFLTHLAGNCFRSGIPEEDTVQWTINSLDLKNYELEVRQTIHNQFGRLAGVTYKPAIPSSQRLVVLTEDFMKRRYRFRYNTQTMDAEYIRLGSFTGHYKPVDERVLNSIALNAQAEGLPLWDRDIRRYIYSDRIPSYSPLENYLSLLPLWDEIDHIRQLARRIPCENSLWPDFFYRWFLSMVAQWLGRNVDYGNSCSPVLIGPQGCGKSTFCLRLLPPELRSLYTDTIDLSRKREIEQALNRFALINLDEFDQVGVNQQSFLKNILQKPASNTKLPYQKSFRPLQRYASFIATSNHRNLLTDLSGDRRYICIEITGKIANDIPIDYKQLYAQAVHLIQQGERYHFTSEEETLIKNMNEEFRVVTPAEQLFVSYFQPPHANEIAKELLAIEILEILKKEAACNFPTVKLSTSVASSRN
ncbi:MAG: helicase [Tannerellaceae bacterium]|nr:helicase [Tannerellaceae bacterium]